MVPFRDCQTESFSRTMEARLAGLGFCVTAPLCPASAQLMGAIDVFTIHNHNGLRAKLINYGATLVELWIPDRAGKLADVILGFDDPRRYLEPHPFLGGTIGRYTNRIAKGRFTLNGKSYGLATNQAPNNLHGGIEGFDRRYWTATQLAENGLRFSRVSPDGEEGFPGNLSVSVTFALNDTNELRITYEAETDQATPVCLTNHSYFNLAGFGTVLNHVLQLNADLYTPVDLALIPTGEISPVAGTPLDFRKAHRIGDRINEMTDVGGYDHNFVLNGKDGEMKLAARVGDPASGREMEIWTTEPGIQFYSGINLEGSLIGKGGLPCQKSGALCLEPQHFPDSPNHPDFPSTILHPAERYVSESVYKFSAR